MSLVPFNLLTATLLLPSLATSLNSTRIADITPTCPVPSAFLDESRIPIIPTRILTIYETDDSLSLSDPVSGWLAGRTSADFTDVVVHVPEDSVRETTDHYGSIASTLVMMLIASLAAVPQVAARYLSSTWWKRAFLSTRGAWRRWMKRKGWKTPPGVKPLLGASCVAALNDPRNKIRKDLILGFEMDDMGAYKTEDHIGKLMIEELGPTVGLVVIVWLGLRLLKKLAY